MSRDAVAAVGIGAVLAALVGMLAAAAIDACTPAHEAAASSLGLCVAGVVEKDWGQPDATVSLDAVVACAALLPPPVSVLDDSPPQPVQPTPAERLAPIIAEATRLIALEK